jgi:hypothetical protein
MKQKLILGAMFLLPVLILLPFLDQFPVHPGSLFSDLWISHYPNAFYIQQTLITERTIPLWSSTILSGYPFAANPLSGLFYIPGWLVVLLPLVIGFNLAIVLHLIFGGVGIYLLLRSEGLGEVYALFGALVFESMPKLYAHLAAGHITLIYAVCWTPWLLLAQNQVKIKRPFWRYVLPGWVLGMIVLADVRWAAYAGAVWLVYRIVQVWKTSVQERDFKPRCLIHPALQLISNLVTACLIAAPLLFPLFEYAQHSTRSQMQPGENLVLSLPPGQLLGLVYPYIRGPAEWILYPGALVLALFLFALTFDTLRRKAAFWMVLAIAALLFALGSYLPASEILASLPGISMLRVPPRALFLAGMALAITAAYAYSSLFQPASAERFLPSQRRFNPLLILFGLTVFGVLFGLAVVFLVQHGPAKVQFGWGTLFIVLSVLAIVVVRRHWISEARAMVLFFVLVLADLSGVNMLALEFRPAEQVLSERKDVAAFLAENTRVERYRVYSPSYSIPQHTGAVYGLELADGIDPLQLENYQQFMEKATGVPSDGYSVTLPSFAEGEPSSDNRAYVPDSALLGLLSVRYVVSEFDLPDSEGLTLVQQMGEARIYENDLVLPRAWMQEPDGRLGQEVRPVLEMHRQANRIFVSAEGPGRLVLSEIDYPGWSARVDGKPVPVQAVNGLLRSVDLGEGVHEVVFTFSPASVYLGLFFGLTAWTILVGMIFWGLWGRRRERRTI